MMSSRQKAQAINRAATELYRKIQTTNALFSSLQEKVQRNDARYSAKIESIRRDIEAYKRRMENIRDTITTKLDSLGFYIPEYSTLHVPVFLNPTAFQGTWNNIREILSRPAEKISQIEFSQMAWVLTLRGFERPEAVERFLNYLVDPVMPMANENPMNVAGLFTVCERKIAGIRGFLEVEALRLVDEQKGLIRNSPAWTDLNDQIGRMIQSSVMLSVVADLLPSDSPIVPNFPAGQHPSGMENFTGKHVLVAQGGGGPFSIGRWIENGELVDEGWLTIQTNRGVHFPHNPPASTVDISMDFSIALPGHGLSVKLHRVVTEDMLLSHAHNPIGNTISDAAGFWLGLVIICLLLKVLLCLVRLRRS